MKGNALANLVLKMAQKKQLVGKELSLYPFGKMDGPVRKIDAITDVLSGNSQHHLLVAKTDTKKRLGSFWFPSGFLWLPTKESWFDNQTKRKNTWNTLKTPRKPPRKPQKNTENVPSAWAPAARTAAAGRPRKVCGRGTASPPPAASLQMAPGPTKPTGKPEEPPAETDEKLAKVLS